MEHIKKTVSTLLISFFCYCSLLIAVTKSITISPASSEITIDGSAEEAAWASVPFINMDQHKGDAVNKNNIAKFKMTYDSKFIYVYIDVVDAIIDTSQSKNVWEKDCVELYFSMDTTLKNAYTGNDGIYQVRKVFGRNYTDFYAKGFKAEEKITSNGYCQEWKFEWDSLANSLKNTLAPYKKIFRFQCVNTDNDGAGRNSQLFWNEFQDDSRPLLIIYWGFVNLVHPLSINNDNTISLKSELIELPESMNYSIYNYYGVIIKQGKANNIKIHDLIRGIYIIRVNGQSLKFFKQ